MFKRTKILIGLGVLTVVIVGGFFVYHCLKPFGVDKAVKAGEAGFLISASNAAGIQITPQLTYYYSGIIGGIDLPRNVVVDNSGRIYITQGWTGSVADVRIYDQNRNFIKKFDSASQGIVIAEGIFIDNDGKIYIADYDDKVKIYNFDGQLLNQFSLSDRPGPYGIAKDAGGNILVVLRYKNRVAVFNSGGQEIGSIGPSEDDHYKFNQPANLHIDKNGFIYVSDWMNHRVQIYNANREYAATLSGLNFPAGVTTDSAGRIYVANGDNKIWVYDQNRNFITSFGGWGTGEYQFGSPAGLFIDQSGRLYVAESWSMNNRVQILSPIASEAAAKPDTTPPTLNLSSPRDGAKISDSLVLAGAASDDSMVSSVQVRISAAAYGGGKICDLISFTPAAAISFNQDFWSCLPIASFPKGEKITVYLKISDSSSNIVEKSINVYYEPAVDTTPPAITISSPQENETIADLILQGRISDVSGVAKWQATVNNQQCGGTTYISPETEVSFEDRSCSSYLKDGLNTIILRADDIKGNQFQKQINVTKKATSTDAEIPVETKPAEMMQDTTEPPAPQALKNIKLSVTAPSSAMAGQNVWITVKAKDEAGNGAEGVLVNGRIIYGDGSLSEYMLSRATDKRGEIVFNLVSKITGRTVTMEFATPEGEWYIPYKTSFEISIVKPPDPSQPEPPKKKDVKGPSIINVTVLPAVIGLKESAVVTAQVLDAGAGVRGVSVLHKLGEDSSWFGNEQPLGYDPETRLWRGIFHSYDVSERGKIYYYFAAWDKNGNYSSYPANAPQELKFIEIDPNKQRPVFPFAGLMNFYPEKSILYLDEGESEAVVYHALVRNVGQVNTTARTRVTFEADGVEFYSDKADKLLVPNEEFDFKFNVPFESSLVGKKITAKAAVANVDTGARFDERESSVAVEVKRKSAAQLKPELQIAKHWPARRIYKVGETAEILAALSNTGETDLKNVKLTVEFLYPLSRAVFSTQSKTVASLKRGQTAIIPINVAITAAQENQNISIRFKAGTGNNLELAKTGIIDNYFEAVPAVKENMVIADGVQFKEAGLSFERKFFKSAKALAVNAKLNLEMKNLEKSKRILGSAFIINKLSLDQLGNIQRKEILNKKDKYNLQGGKNLGAAFGYNFKKADSGIYEIDIKITDEKGSVLFSSAYTIVGKTSGKDFWEAEKNLLLGGEALVAYKTLSDLSGIDSALKHNFGPYRQFALFAAPISAEFFRMITGAPNYLEMQDALGTYGKSGIVLASARILGSAMAEIISPILDAADALRMAADPKSSGIYQSLQQATAYAGLAGDWTYYETVVDKHEELIDKFRDLYLTAAFGLANGNLGKVKSDFEIQSDSLAGEYNDYFGPEGNKKDTIYKCYQQFGMDFIMINSVVQNQYLSGTEKGFYTQLPSS